MTRQDKFTRGQRVDWAPDMRARAEDMGHPDGPFMLTSVEDGPKGNLRAMGHTQFVTVREIPGQSFSGAWFVRASPPEPSNG